MIQECLGILELIGFIAPVIEKKLPARVNVIAGAIVVAPLARIIATVVNPGVTFILSRIGETISMATDQSPIPGLLAPFAFNPPVKVLMALAFAALGGLLAGNVGGLIFKHLCEENKDAVKVSEAA